MSEHLAELRTPCALVDWGVLEKNCARMSGRARSLGVVLRPHVKTHKCVEIARIQTRGHSSALTVSTMAEARAFAAAGFNDLTYAVPVPFHAIPEAADLLARGTRLSLLLDSEVALRELEAAGSARNLRLPVFLKVDCGYHRAGVDPGREESLELARALAASPHLEFRGILTHSGQAYRCASAEEALSVAEHERDVMAAFAGKLRSAGVPVPEVSVGSTPACCAARDWSGATEIRPGNYAFFDAFQAAIGSCALEDALAFTVLATVIGHYPERKALLLDAGALALSKDPGATHVDAPCGFGVLCDVPGRPIRGLRLGSLSQEHGQVVVSDPTLFARMPLGSKVRIIPNHSCLAAACFGSYVVLKDGRADGKWDTVGRR